MQASWAWSPKEVGGSWNAHGGYYAAMEQECRKIVEDHSLQGTKKWENVQGWMEWNEL
jgi:hypothetical protein